ncbi:hypothetical protein B1B_02683, partial [mine drainage metagenome]
MKDLDQYSSDELKALLADEGWDTPLAPVHRQQLKPWQQGVFWALRIYVVIMCI